MSPALGDAALGEAALGEAALGAAALLGDAVLNLSRRGFLRAGVLAGGGLLLGVHVPWLRPAAAQDADPADPANPGGPADPAAPFAPNAFVRVAADGQVTVIVNHSEMGQGIYTGLAMIVAEELDADWARVRVEPAPVHPDYNHTAFGVQATGGSTSTWTEWERLRKAGAAARAMLVAAAAAAWQVDPATCTTASGQVLHADSGRQAGYGELAAAAAQQTPPQEVPLKDPSRFQLIGKATPRLDTPAKTDGSAVFGLDVSLPGMLVAVVARPPVFGGKLVRMDAARAKAVPGVREVVQIERGVAVVATGYWAAHKGRDALDLTWDEGPLAGLDSQVQGEQYAALARKPGAIAHASGQTEQVLAAAPPPRRLDAVYELPYLAHACMEPLNCVADVRADRCELWVGTQFQTIDAAAAARACGLDPAQVTLHTTLLGGGFGRRAVADSHFVVEAAQVSKAVQAPVKLIWSREDDTRGGYYRPRALHALAGALDAQGKPIAWRQRVVCQSFVKGTPFEAMMIKNGVDELAVEGSADLAYALENLQVEWHEAPAGVPCLWWRSVGHSHTAFANECFLDELAHAGQQDPLALRLELLAQRPRHKAALELAAEKAGWGTPLPAGRGRGLAVHASFGSFVAEVAEVSVSPQGVVRVHKVVCAIDCGPVVNPQQVIAQLESAVVFGLSAALHGEITFAQGRVVQSNFHDYRLLRMQEMPQVEVHIVPSSESMGGVGEPGVPPVAPAVANAVFAATGKRVRRLPIRAEELRRS